MLGVIGNKVDILAKSVMKNKHEKYNLKIYFSENNRDVKILIKDKNKNK